MCLVFEPGAAGWKAQTNPLSYSGTPRMKSYVECYQNRIEANLNRTKTWGNWRQVNRRRWYYRIAWKAFHVLPGHDVIYMLPRAEIKHPDCSFQAVWPDWAIFEGPGNNFSYRSRPNFWANFKKRILRKIANFWQHFRINWATFYSHIWSNWFQGK